MPLEQLLSETVKPEIYFRGLRYFRRGAVYDFSKTENFISAKVEGGYVRPYTVKIDITNNKAYCNCPFGFTEWCKHIVAVIIYFSNHKNLGNK